MKRWALFSTFITVGCGGLSTCPNDLPNACPTQAPGYTTEIEPIISSRCSLCHVSGGLAGSVPLTSPGELHQRQSIVLHEVYSCLMPPPGAHPLTPDERAVLLRWLVCGAPEAP